MTPCPHVGHRQIPLGERRFYCTGCHTEWRESKYSLAEIRRMMNNEDIEETKR